MIIACATDSRFCQLAGTMLASVVANGEIGDSRIVVLGFGLSARDKENIRASCGAKRDQVTFIDVDAADPVIARVLHSRPRLNPAFYARLALPDLFADVHDTVLYLDSDTILTGSLRPLIELDLGAHVAAAVPETDETHPGKHGRYAFPVDAPYFNSGVILMDIAKWREQEITEAVLNVIDQYGDALQWFDQDALNLALLGRWLPLGPEWNVHEATSKVLGGYDGARIVHFTGSTKPSFAECKHPQRDLFLRYRALTPWRGHRLQTRFERRWRKTLGKRKKRLLDGLAGLIGGERPGAAPQQPRRNP